MVTVNDAEDCSVVGSLFEVFRVFLKLGLTLVRRSDCPSGYFRDELVVRRRWIDEARYADLVALCQFLPGEASSQVGFSLGVLRGRDLLGGLASWTGLTLPSALILLAFALGAGAFTGPLAQSFLHGWWWPRRSSAPAKRGRTPGLGSQR